MVRSAGRRSLLAATLFALAFVLPATAIAHQGHFADPDEGVPHRVARALGGEVSVTDKGLYRVRADGFAYTTHGPDFGAAMGVGADPSTRIGVGSPERAPRCINNPATDYYQEVLYAHPPGANNLAARKAEIQAQIRRNNYLLNQESQASGGPSADYNVLCESDGSIKVTAFEVPGTPPTTFTQVVNAAKAAGYGDGTTNTNVDYTIFYDGEGDACGVGYLYGDDRAIVNNFNNNPGNEAGYGVTYGPCWFNRTSMHENAHNQGATQAGAPNSTGDGGHCNERNDIMCYVDGGNLNQTMVNCPGEDPASSVVHFDCQWNTYFDSAPEAGEWLASHWNIGSTSLNRFITFGGPTANFTHSCTGLTCNFTDQSSTSGGIASRSWSFGDGATSTATNPSHTYSAPGAYDVTLTVTDTGGFSTSITKRLVFNNNFADAQPITGNSATVSGSNAGANKEAGEPNHAGFAGGASVWYRWTAPASGTTTIDTCGSTFDSLLGVYTGTAVNALTAVAANDDANPSCASGLRQSRVTFNAVAGTIYRIAVDGYQAEQGNITLHLAGSGDSTPPVVTITGGPEGPTSANSPSFTFVANEGGVNFECKLDGGGFSPCSSPQGYSGLADGAHTFSVRGTDGSGNTSTAVNRGFTVDTVAPDTQINSGPSGTIDVGSAVFGFSAVGSEPGATFECSTDGGVFGPCTSPAAISGLAEGPHTFAVRAVDPAGNADPTPASRGFTVDLPAPVITDTLAPETTITNGPLAKIKTKRAAIVSFEFASNEPNTVFFCSIAQLQNEPCSSPQRYRVRPGSYTFSVYGVDLSNNADTSAATHTFKVKKKRRRR